MNTKKIISLFFVLILCFSLFACKNNDGEVNDVEIDVDSIKNICSLCTLKHIIHTTAYGDKPTKFLLVFDKDYKAIFEYDTEVEISVDVDVENIKIDTLKKVVEVPLSDPKITKNEVIDESITHAIVYDAKKNIKQSKVEISIEDKKTYITEAQKSLISSLEEDQTGFAEATANAKELIENYVNVVSNNTYTTKFVPAN